MSVNSVELYPDHSLSKMQSELLDKSEYISSDTKKYHAAGIIKTESLLFFAFQQDDSASLQSLVKANFCVKSTCFPFNDLAFHVYFIDTDYPILYKQVNATLHFFLPGSGVNYNNEELADNPKIFSRVVMNYFNDLLNHDKPMHEIFRGFQFNGINCRKIREIQMDGVSLGGAMQHFLLVYILQNIHRFSHLRGIELNIASPSCLHPKIIESLSQQFSDALLQINYSLSISMRYSMHLKDFIVRNGNPFALRYTGFNVYNIAYGIEFYAYCEEWGCDHKMQGAPSDRYICDIIPSRREWRRYHKTSIDLGRYGVYQEFYTSNFRDVQHLIDKFFLRQDHLDTFKNFFLNSYGNECLENNDVHFILFRHEKLADTILGKYKTTCILSEDEAFKAVQLNKAIHDLEELEGVFVLRYLAKKKHPVSRKRRKWKLQYLELCNAKSELAKLIAAKSNQN